MLAYTQLRAHDPALFASHRRRRHRVSCKNTVEHITKLSHFSMVSHRTVGCAEPHPNRSLSIIFSNPRHICLTLHALEGGSWKPPQLVWPMRPARRSCVERASRSSGCAYVFNIFRARTWCIMFGYVVC